MREVAAELERPVLLFSGGKDSIVLLRLAEKAFRPGRFPFPLMHVDTGHNFPEVIEYRDRRVAELGERLVVASVQESIDTGRVVEQTGPRASRNQLQTTTLLDAMESNQFDAAIGGARRDEERSRAKERIFSFRDDFGQWDPRAQRPELWNLYNGKIRKGEQVRVFPISNWTELDVWQYVAREALELPSIYYAHEREVFERDGMLYATSDVIERDDDEVPFTEWVRFRTVGDMSCTGAVRSHATSRSTPSSPRSRRHGSPSAARPARTIARPRPRWRTGSVSGISDPHLVDVARRRHSRPAPPRHLRLGRRRQVDADRPPALRHEAGVRRPDGAGGGDERAPRRRLRQPRAPDRRAARRARAGNHDRRRLPRLRHAETPLPARRCPGPRAVHAQHGHGRLDRRRRGRPRRRAQGRDRADAPPHADRVAARGPAPRLRGQQDGSRRLRRGAVQRDRAGARRADRRARRQGRGGDPDRRPARRQRRRALRPDPVVAGRDAPAAPRGDRARGRPQPRPTAASRCSG